MSGTGANGPGPPKKPPDISDSLSLPTTTSTTTATITTHPQASAMTGARDTAAQDAGYAAAAALHVQRRTKWIEVEMFKTERSTKIQMTEEEHAKIVHQLNIDPKRLHRIDDSRKVKVRFEIDAEVDLSTLNLHQAIQVRRGLRTQPIKQHAHLEFVKVYKTSAEDSNEAVAEMLRDFAKLEV